MSRQMPFTGLQIDPRGTAGFPSRPCAVLAAIVAFTACDPGGTAGAPGESAVVRDSAGVRVVENVAPANDTLAWSVSAAPLLAIGAGDGDPSLLFHQIPHPGLARLGDGSILVIDGATNQLRYFDPEGEHRLTSGGSGDGPGEFRAAGALLALRADSAYVLDHFAARLSVFGPGGAFARSVSLREIPGFIAGAMFPFGFGPDGSLLIQGTVTPPPAGTGPVLAEAPLFRVDAGAAADAGTAPGAWTMLAEVPIAAMATDAQQRPRPVFPGVQAVPRAASGGVWIGVPTLAELRRTNQEGSLDRIVRFAGLGSELDADETARIADWYAEVTRGIPEQARGMMAQPAILSRWPAFATVLVDSDQHLWIQEVGDDRDPQDWEYGTPRGSPRWRVVDPDGIWLGTLDLPEGFQPHVIGRDFLLGVWRDAVQAEFVHMYGLARN